MLVAWIAFPVLLLALSVGCGLLVERVYGERIAGPLLPSLGLAVIIIVAYGATTIKIGALIVPWLVLVLAVAGFALGLHRLRSARVDGWAAGLGIAVFAAFGAPVVLTGEPTFLGYFVNNDSSFQFVLVDWLFDHGRVVPEAMPSAYEATAAGYLASGYPLGSHMPLGVGRTLLGADAAWLFVPYLALVLMFAALALYSLARAVRPPMLRALAAFVAITSGLVYSYFASQSAIKELAMLWALIAAVAVLVETLPRLPALRALVPAALVFVAGFYVLSLAALPWLGVSVAAFGGVVLWRMHQTGWRSAGPQLALIAGVLLVVGLTAWESITQFVGAQVWALTGPDIGILAAPLSKWQTLGIWPTGDFRLPLTDHARLGYALLGIAFASFVLGALWTVRRRLLGPLLLLASAVLAFAYLVPRGGPYADAKVYMIASGAFVFTSMLGASSLHQSGRRVEGWLLALVIAAGVIWTDALVLKWVRAAPHDRYAELTSVGERLAGHGPTLFTESDEFIAYFARDAQPIGGFYGGAGSPHELRADAPSAEAHVQGARIPTYDLDELLVDYVQRHPTIVLRRSPTASRPPANYERTWIGDYYEIWQRAESQNVDVVERLPLGEGLQPAERAPCQSLRALAARAAKKGARLAYVERPVLPTLIPPETAYDDGQWANPSPEALSPITNDAQLSGELSVAEGGEYVAWMRGIFERGFSVSIDGSEIGRVESELFVPGQFARLGHVRLSPGTAEVSIRRQEEAFRPGQRDDEMGPLVLQHEKDDEQVRFASPDRVEELCGRRLDWVELLVP